MPPILSHAPTPQQQQGIDWLCARVADGEPVSALTGYAGTGKTTVISHLRTRFLEMGLPVTLAAPMHRAAAVLRAKGMASVETVHRACTVPYFTPPYVAALQWFGEESAVLGSGDLYALAEEYDDEGIPRLVRSALAQQRSSRTPQMLKAQVPPFTAERTCSHRSGSMAATTSTTMAPSLNRAVCSLSMRLAWSTRRCSPSPVKSSKRSCSWRIQDSSPRRRGSGPG